MRIGFVALAVMVFSPPPCQKDNEDFLYDDAGATESGADTSGTPSTTLDDATASDTTSAEASSDDGVEETATGTGSEGETGETSSATESTGSSDDGPCPAPEELCGNTCVDTTSDHNNCGMCGNSCHPVHENCENSQCVPN
jgi:hypothetical protein